MKKATLILTLIFGVLLFSSSKTYVNDNKSQKTRRDSLMNKKWVYEGKSTTSMVFNKDIIVAKSIVRNGEFIFNNSYYLTDDISKMEFDTNGEITNFDWTKVGESFNGKYLVFLDEKWKSKTSNGVIYMYLILELTNNKLVLQLIYHTGEWGAFPSKVYNAEPLN